ncbi:hypothetical protein DOM21_17305 [Bacteriovorax stolpii]|uniref:Uncharacterized protein n=1 Tax=Bacteriovorax stolpii TaxID=960 RepID=A0A2K9NMY4_BACTC|nr:hypothetical protein [Bacteriovorax stolpii]AUN96891.1 hypothetical protein C0V70_01970 [Bacteriovorax stolpii]QDK43180.1 hypothetical protein DOM21_17305 [Bacteriovorax stolpii]TDP53169.1 hypothetical protein C8D79_1811 [Bacteriovorax stolpii]
MKQWGKFVPYLIVAAFCLINVGIVGPNRDNKVRLPFFNWCLFCTADAPHIKYYEVQVKKDNVPVMVFNNRNNRNQKDSLRITEIMSLYTKSQLTSARLKEFIGEEKASVSLYEVGCDIHQWFIQNDCGPTKLLAVYEI